MPLFESEIRLPRPIDEVFPFFAQAENLEEITPPSLRFSVITPKPIAMRKGALIDYKLRIRGFPVRWQSEITAWDPPRRFVDEQRRGPYRKWRHEHDFQEDGDGTIVRDRVTYEVPGGRFLGRILDRLMVHRDVERIFEYRRRVLEERFQRDPRARPGDPTGGR